MAIMASIATAVNAVVITGNTANIIVITIPSIPGTRGSGSGPRGSGTGSASGADAGAPRRSGRRRAAPTAAGNGPVGVVELVVRTGPVGVVRFVCVEVVGADEGVSALRAAADGRDVLEDGGHVFQREALCLGDEEEHVQDAASRDEGEEQEIPLVSQGVHHAQEGAGEHGGEGSVHERGHGETLGADLHWQHLQHYNPGTGSIADRVRNHVPEHRKHTERLCQGGHRIAEGNKE
mmetsp:Transcript_20242/g.33866  ORF Transcript_20242/g.33866 Transcript_20242/m.33866 type:complete len:235 (+) Transcript_20242:6173-6877(+)